MVEKKVKPNGGTQQEKPVATMTIEYFADGRYRTVMPKDPNTTRVLLALLQERHIAEMVESIQRQKKTKKRIQPAPPGAIHGMLKGMN